jgi:hypothetical protein
VAQPTAAGRVIAAWPSFALIGAYELLMRQVRRNAAGGGKPQPRRPGPQVSQRDAGDTVLRRSPAHHNEPGGSGEGQVGRALRARSFSGRRGTGRWPTGPVMARCPVGVRSPATTAGRSGGAGWSNAQAPQASLAPIPANPPCAW